MATNGLWKGAFASSRAFPMRGYFEWTAEPATSKRGSCTATTGCSPQRDQHRRKVGDEWEVSTSIITRQARDTSGKSSPDPGVPRSDVWDEYLAPDKLDDAGKHEMVPLLTVESEKVAGTISSYEVDRRVNNSRTADPTDPTLIQPLD